MVKDGKMFKAKNRKQKQDERQLKAAISAMPKPMHPKKGSQAGMNRQKMVSEDTEAVPIENIFAQKLASNDPTMRNRAVKKLKKWLEARSVAGSDPFSEVEMMRLWKGLHYCFWMSDKPLVQEELAESIGSMTTCFGSNSSSAFLFISSFLRTMGREWIGIDRWRMDKFMMLVRRVLRYCFVYLAKSDWDAKLVAEFCDIVEKKAVSVNTINQQTKTKKQKRDHEATENEEAAIHVFHASLGFQLHFIDIFLEELAKIGGENLPAETIHSLIQPFINELAGGDDDRLNKHIEERIFHHLMRQSDIGIAYEESDEEEDQEDDDEDEVTGDGDDAIGEDDDEEMMIDSSFKDPRAGKVDVILPQLQPDYEHLSKLLFEAGSKKNVAKKNCNRLYALSKKMKDLAAGVYPLAEELSDDESEIPKAINPKRAAVRAAREEVKMELQAKEEKRRFKEEMRLKQKGISIPAEKQEVKMIENEEEQDTEHEEAHVEPETKKSKKEKKNKKDKSMVNEAEETEKKTGSVISEERKEKKKKQKLKEEHKPIKGKMSKKKSTQNGEVSSPIILSLSPEQKSQIQKKIKKLEADATHPDRNKEDSGLGLNISVEKMKTKKKDKGAIEKDAKDTGLVLNIFGEGKKSKKMKKKAEEAAERQEDVITISSKKRKLAKTPEHKPISSDFLTSSLPSKVTGLKKKRINFSLMQNKCSSLHEIDKSILDSPEIPFSADRKPKQGVLKKTGQDNSANTTPNGSGRQSVALNTMLNGRSKFLKRRSVASDFL